MLTGLTAAEFRLVRFIFYNLSRKWLLYLIDSNGSSAVPKFLASSVPERTRQT